MTRSAPPLTALAAAAGLCLSAAALPALAAQPASDTRPAQAATAQERFVIVTSEQTGLVTGPDDATYYDAGRLQRGQVLRVVDERGDYIRVEYPRQVDTAFISASRVEPAGEGRLRITQPNTLLAPDTMRSFGQSWAPLYSRPIPAGVELELIESFRGASGDVVGYRVKIPTRREAGRVPFGYVRKSAVAEATPAQVAAWRRSLEQPAQTGEGADAQTGRQQDTQTPPANAGEAPGQAGGEATTAGNQQRSGDTDGSLLNPLRVEIEGRQVPAGSRDNAEQDPAGNQPGNQTGNQAGNQAGNQIGNQTGNQGGQSAGQPGAQTGNETGGQTGERSGADRSGDAAEEIDQSDANRPTGEDGPQRVSAAELRDLERKLRRVMTLPQGALDDSLDELLAEFQRTRDAAEDPAVQEYIASRLDWIRLRIATRDRRRSLQEAIAQADDRSRALADRVEQIRSERAYDMVGRLVNSTVYDGDALPLMYRVESISDRAGVGVRTLGYVMPAEGENYGRMLGAVVGIRGETQFDDALKLMIIEPTDLRVLVAAERQPPE